MIRNPVKTFSQEQIIRVETPITLPRHVDLERVRPAVLEAINTHSATTAQKYTTALITGFDEGGTKLSIYHYFNPQNDAKIGRYRYIGETHQNVYSALQ
jgi:small-conductance mechanosensitive channel